MRTFLLAVFICVVALGMAACRHLPQPKASPRPSSPLTNTPPAQPSTSTPAASPDAAGTPLTGDPYRQIHLLTRSLLLIRHNYVDESKVSYSNLIMSALGGMLSSLDPYSQFLGPSAYRDLQETTHGAFGGIGIQVGAKEGFLTVIAPIEDTPASRAGLLAGDKITEIDGQRTDQMSLSDAIRRLRGDKGSTVKLKIQRGRESREFSLIREIIRVTSVKGARMLEKGIAYVRITDFSEPTATVLLEAMRKLETNTIQALVLDLRNNPGGLLTSAIDCSSLFLEPGKRVVSTRGRGENPREIIARSSGQTHYTDFPMAVLVNGGSASAAEIVAGALQDNKRAVLVGEPTFGKGSVQNIIALDDGCALRLTTALYYTPSSRCIHEKGIEPDIVVPIAMEEWPDILRKRAFIEGAQPETEKPAHFDQITDRQLDRAIDLLKGILIFRSHK